MLRGDEKDLRYGKLLNCEFEQRICTSSPAKKVELLTLEVILNLVRSDFLNRWTYNTSKGAINMLTKVMALDMEEGKVRVNSISPACIWTPEVAKADSTGNSGFFFVFIVSDFNFYGS